MKLQIDTKAKTIKTDENVRFDELIKVLDKLLPKEWKSYTLISNCTIQWYNPIPYFPSTLWITPPWGIRDVTYVSQGELVTPTGTGDYTTNVMDGVYNVDVVEYV